MKSLDLSQLEELHGAGVCEAGGASAALGVLAIGAGIATGGVGFFVVGGLGLYFGTGIGLLCAM